MVEALILLATAALVCAMVAYLCVIVTQLSNAYAQVANELERTKKRLAEIQAEHLHEVALDLISNETEADS